MIFQGSVVAGLLFFLAVFISKPIAALYAVVGGLLGAYISLMFAEPSTDIHMGLFSFNAVLCAITFAGDRIKDGVYVLIAVIAAVILDVVMVKMGLSVLTFPFVAACWLTLSIKKIVPDSWK
ncbi:Urea transporter [compost metagenome]